MLGGHERNLLPSRIRPADPLVERAQKHLTTDPLPGGFDDDVPHDGRTFPRDVAQPVRASRGVLTWHHPEVAADRVDTVKSVGVVNRGHHRPGRPDPDAGDRHQELDARVRATGTPEVRLHAMQHRRQRPHTLLEQVPLERVHARQQLRGGEPREPAA